MLDFVIDITAAYFNSGMATFWFFYFIAFLFLCTVPFILRYFFRR